MDADDDDVTAAADVVLAVALLVGLVVVDASVVLAVLLVVAAAELVAGADVDAAVVVAGAADDVESAAEVEGATDEVAALDPVVVVAVGVPQAASSEAPSRLPAPVSATWITCRRRNGAPVIECTSDIVTWNLLDRNTTQTWIKGDAADH